MNLFEEYKKNYEKYISELNEDIKNARTTLEKFRIENNQNITIKNLLRTTEKLHLDLIKLKQQYELQHDQIISNPDANIYIINQAMIFFKNLNKN